MQKENISRDQLAAKAAEMITNHGLKEVYITSDGQGFTDETRAHDRASYLRDKNIHHFEADKTPQVLEVASGADADERKKLANRYEELFGKKPAHNLGLEKLKSQLQEKEKELEEAASIDVSVNRKEDSEKEDSQELENLEKEH